MADSVRVRAVILGEMLAHARRDAPLECCGLLAGRDGVIIEILPAKNALASPTRYEIASRDLFDLFRFLRDERLTHMGQYHSHPLSDNAPSATDIELACYPEHPYFIISPLPVAAKPIRAFSISEGSVRELEILPTA